MDSGPKGGSSARPGASRVPSPEWERGRPWSISSSTVSTGLTFNQRASEPKNGPQFSREPRLSLSLQKLLYRRKHHPLSAGYLLLGDALVVLVILSRPDPNLSSQSEAKNDLLPLDFNAANNRLERGNNTSSFTSEKKRNSLYSKSTTSSGFSAPCIAHSLCVSNCKLASFAAEFDFLWESV